MYSLNPTIIPYNSSLFLLVRKESNVLNWKKSIMSYELHEINSSFKSIKNYQCSFQNKNIIYKNISREELTNEKIAFEDIKFCFIKDNKIYGISNILLKQTNPRIFCVGIIEINIKNKILKLHKILEKSNMSMMEKNWTIFNYNNKNYIITNLLPYLKIYELTNNFELVPYINKYIYNNEKFLSYNLHPTYQKLFLTPCQSPIKINNDCFLLFTKKRLKSSVYQYFISILDLKKISLNIIPIIIEKGYKKYLNSVHIINGKIVGCFGLEDKNYEIKNIILPNYLKKIIMPYSSNNFIKL